MQKNIYFSDGRQEQSCFKSIHLGKDDSGTIIKAAREFKVFSVLEER